MNIKKNPQSKFIKDWVDNSTHNINMSMKTLIFKKNWRKMPQL